MTVIEFVRLLNEDLRNELKHMMFYLHSSHVLSGMARLYLHDRLAEHAKDEMSHASQFASKIRALGGYPVHVPNAFATELTDANDILKYALAMEQEVVKNYHERHKQATTLYEETGSHYDLVIFLEEQIEESQEDIDELLKVLNMV